MNNISNEKIVNYINEIYIDNKVSFELEELRVEAEKNNVPIIHREVGEFIRTIIRLYKPKRILEIGTAIGFSSIYFASFSDDDTKITTIEINEDTAEIARANIKKYGFEDRINVVCGDAIEVIPTLQDDYDFIFIDAAKGQYIHFFELIEAKLSDNAVILSDNILFRGMVGDNDLVKRRKITIVKRLRKYLSMLTNKEGYTTSILQIGDGVSLTVKEKL